MKSLFLITLGLFILSIINTANAQSVDGFGEAPINPKLTFQEARLLARNAALLDIEKQTKGVPFRITREVFLEGGIYFIRVEI